tara:strand:+ start:4598 stop:5755 length:1158 start_codon:yes stop_codon:yes gene_type:complete
MIYYKLINKKNFFKAIITSFFLVIFSIDTSFASSLNKIRLSYDEQASKLRIVFDANKKINYVINKSPDNLIKISFKDIRISDNFQKPQIENPDIQTFKLAKNKNNLEFTFKSKKSFKYKYFSLGPDGNYGHRYVLDVVMGKLVNNNKIDNTPKKIKKTKFVIAIDAGHGGKDPGAVGRGGTLEKDIVLSISKKLYKLLNKEKNIKPVLIRTKDYYIPLRQRIKKARKYKADLFISIHADAARNRKARGSSVYVLSQHGATSEAAKWLANKENSADLIGGVSIEDKDNVLAQVILDLSQSATIETSIKAASVLLSKIGKVSKLHLKNIEQAGFVVLKSPDIPSILVETAFLSNSKEEKKLRTKKFQNNIAKALRDGIIEIIKRGII